MCEPLHIEALSHKVACLPCSVRTEMETYMRTTIKLAITIAIMGALGLMLLEKKDAANARPNRGEHTETSDPYLPIQRIMPVW